MMVSASLNVCDVLADGNCFYRCYVQCFGTEGDEEEDVMSLRQLVAGCVTTDPGTRSSLKSLLVIMKECRDNREELYMDNPLMEGARSLADIAANITANHVWASQIEVGVVRKLAAIHGVALVVVEGGTSSATDQLIAALDKAGQPLCVVFVRIDNCHYQYLTGSTQKVFPTDWLIYKACTMAMLEDAEDQLF